MLKLSFLDLLKIHFYVLYNSPKFGVKSVKVRLIRTSLPDMVQVMSITNIHYRHGPERNTKSIRIRLGLRLCIKFTNYEGSCDPVFWCQLFLLIVLREIHIISV